MIPGPGLLSLFSGANLDGFHVHFSGPFPIHEHLRLQQLLRINCIMYLSFSNLVFSPLVSRLYQYTQTNCLSEWYIMVQIYESWRNHPINWRWCGLFTVTSFLSYCTQLRPPWPGHLADVWVNAFQVEILMVAPSWGTHILFRQNFLQNGYSSWTTREVWEQLIKFLVIW